MTHQNPPELIRGIVEGFYGVFYTFPERLDLIRFAGERGFNLYLYAPKNDRQHRARWWEAYPERIMSEFAETVRTARNYGMVFAYGISPGGSICYSSADDFARLAAKLSAMLAIGVRVFSLMLDDNEPGFRYAQDAGQYQTPAHAQADLTNRLYAWLQEQDPACRLSMVPADYSGTAPFPESISILGSSLHPDIDLCYTGPEVSSPSITREDAEAFAAAACRKPLIWDNYPVNDLAMQPELHLGPVSGRAADLPAATRGFLVNPMIQPEASKIPLSTYAEYLSDPAGYNPNSAWDRAVHAAAGEASELALATLAENAVSSCLGQRGARMSRLAATADWDLRGAGSHYAWERLECRSVHSLEEYLVFIDEACYHLKFRMENLALRSDLLPWIEVLEHWMWMTRFALDGLRSALHYQPFEEQVRRVHEYQGLIARHPKNLACRNLEPLVTNILKMIEHSQRELIPNEERFRLEDESNN